MSEISVVIPTKNEAETLDELLNSIRNQNICSVEIIIVDSGSKDGTLTIAQRYADKLVEIPSRDFHHGKTRNLGAAKANGEIIVFTVGDAIPVNEDWLPLLVDPIKSGEADISYGNQIPHPDAKPPDRFFYQYFYPDETVELDKSDTNNESEFYLNNIFISDVSSAISRSVWDEFQFRNCVSMSEDKDFAYRAAAGGYTIRYSPEAKIYHSHDYTLRSLFKRRFNDGKAYSNIATGSSSEFLSEGIQYIRNEYQYLIQSGFIYWIPYTIIYDFIYFISFIAGKNHNRLPSTVTNLLK